MSKINYEKFANTVLYLLDQCTPTRPGLVALMKLVWYADYWHYQRFLRLVTDGVYVAQRMGPVLDEYEKFFQRMVDEGLVQRLEVDVYNRPNKKVEYRPLKKHNAEMFAASEHYIVQRVVKELGSLTTEQLVERSHTEGPWSLVWKGNAEKRRIPMTAFRWLDNLPTDEDLAAARDRLGRADIKRELAGIR
jgi:uncharacterized phage-associated protein